MTLINKENPESKWEVPDGFNKYYGLPEWWYMYLTRAGKLVIFQSANGHSYSIRLSTAVRAVSVYEVGIDKVTIGETGIVTFLPNCFPTYMLEAVPEEIPYLSNIRKLYAYKKEYGV